MELVILLVFLISLDLLALRFGADSRRDESNWTNQASNHKGCNTVLLHIANRGRFGESANVEW
jgi:hypothetical protein